jgi:hypothetical protein
MNKTLHKWIILTLIIFTLVPSYGSDVITNYQRGYINWNDGSINATGKSAIEIEENGSPVDFYDRSSTSINKARIDSYESAREVAIENIMSAIKAIQVDPITSFSDLLKSEEFTQKKLAMILSGAKLKRIPFNFDSSLCEIKITIGDLITTIPYDFPEIDLPVIDDTPLRTQYSSLLVDCRGLGIVPMIFPSIYNEDGLEIYGRIYVNSRYAVKYGVTAYSYSEDDPKSLKRTGFYPFYTVALKNSNGCPVISNRDTKRILSHPKTRNNLKKCRVIFILDKKKPERIISRTE